jgi:hypothetical protein
MYTVLQELLLTTVEIKECLNRRWFASIGYRLPDESSLIHDFTWETVPHYTNCNKKKHMTAVALNLLYYKHPCIDTHLVPMYKIFNSTRWRIDDCDEEWCDHDPQPSDNYYYSTSGGLKKRAVIDILCTQCKRRYCSKMIRRWMGEMSQLKWN